MGIWRALEHRQATEGRRERLVEIAPVGGEITFAEDAAGGPARPRRGIGRRALVEGSGTVGGDRPERRREFGVGEGLARGGRVAGPVERGASRVLGNDRIEELPFPRRDRTDGEA